MTAAATTPRATSSSSAPGSSGLALAAALARAGLARRARRSRRRRDAAQRDGRRRRLGPARLRDQPGQRRVPARASARGSAAGRAHRRRSRRCDIAATRRARCSSRPTSWASARWRGSSRSARCVPRSSRRVRDAAASTSLAPCGSRSLAWRADAAELGWPTARTLVGAAGRRRRRRALVDRASRPASRSDPRPYGQTASWPTSPCERAHRGCARCNGSCATAACSPGCRCRAGASRSCGRRRSRSRAELLALDARRARGARGACGRQRAGRADGASRRPPRFRSRSLRLPTSVGHGWRSSAMPPTACIPLPGRVSISGSATRPRSPRCSAARGP